MVTGTRHRLYVSIALDTHWRLEVFSERADVLMR